MVEPVAAEPDAPDDPRWEPGMPVLDRQAVGASTLPPSLRGLPPRSVPELRPTPLQTRYIQLNVVALGCGVVAITALELGAGLASPLVKLSVLAGAPILLLTTADAALRIWRSAWAWMPVNRGRGAFRLAWFGLTVLLIAVLGAATWVVASA
jgi:hypothetical protein